MKFFESSRGRKFRRVGLKSLMGTTAIALQIPGAASAGSAEQLCFTDAVPLQTTSWIRSVTVPRFDPALGDLQSIQFTVSTEAHGSAGAENTSTQARPTEVVLQFQIVVELARPDASILAVANPMVIFDDTLQTYDGTTDFGGTSGILHTGIVATDTQTSVSPPPLSDLALFTGPAGAPGTITLPITAIGSAMVTGPGNLIATFSSEAAATITVCYDYLGNVPPVISTPACNTTIPATATVPLSFQVCATDSNLGDIVTLTAVTLPAGATTDPPLPQSSTSPVCTTVDWTPASAQVGNHTFTFTATDDHGRSSTCSFTVVVAECHLLIGMGRGATQVDIWGHLYDTLLNSIRTTFPVTMEDHPPIYLPPNRTIYAQVLMYNPEIYPQNPSQWSSGVKVHRSGDGTLSTVWHGQRNGILLHVTTETINGQEYIRFPFVIE